MVYARVGQLALRCVLTDPVVLSTSGAFGPTDLGQVSSVVPSSRVRG
jgi:hypothetical protein